MGVRPSELAAILQAAASFSPLSLSPALWLSDTGSDPGEWPDLSGNGRNATQNDVGRKPAIAVGALNGRQVRSFDGGDELVTQSIASTAAFSFFGVVKPDTWRDTNYRCIFGHGYQENGSGGKGIAVYKTGPQQEDWQAYDYLAIGNSYNSGRAPRAIGPSSAGNDARIISVKLGPTESRVWINGATASTRSEIAGDILSFSAPARIGNSAAQSFIGSMAEVIVFQTDISTANRQAVERYLSAKWGIALS